MVSTTQHQLVTFKPLVLWFALVLLINAGALGVDGRSLLGPVFEPRFEDLDGIQSRRFLRVLVCYNPTDYFITLGRQRGLEYEYFQEYGKHLNQGRAPLEQVEIVYIPVAFDSVLTALEQGYGDVAAAGLTVTSERSQRVAFTEPYLQVDEIIVSHRGVTDLQYSEDLSGRTVVVPRASSFAEHLERCNERLRDQGLAPMQIQRADPTLDTEDLLEMVNAGIFDLTVADDHKARLWAEALPGLVCYENIKVNQGGALAWAVRQDNPLLKADLNRFIAQNKKGTLIGNVLFKRYFENVRWITNPLSPDEQAKFETLRPLFERYAGMYGFDPMLVAAQGYQESGLNHDTKSHAGAVGIMQLLPSTAADAAVGIPNIQSPEDNIHAGIKYLAHLRDRFFNEESLTPQVRVQFALAAYNAGPGRVRQFRGRAQGLGLDPNLWFNHVEVAAYDIVGRETPRYVANIYKYYIAYSLVVGRQDNKASTP